MAISTHPADNEKKKFLESSVTGQPGVVVVNPDGSDVGSSIQGNVASGATDSGNPVKVGGVYNSTPPTLTNGKRGDLQLDELGNARTSGGWFEIGSLSAGSLNADLVPSTDVSV